MHVCSCVSQFFLNGSQSAAGNNCTMLVFKYIFYKNSLISNTFNKLSKHIKYVYVTNAQDCATAAGNIIDLLHIYVTTVLRVG